MTSTTPEILKTLDPAGMRFLAGCAGPCITMTVPAHHPGAQGGSRRTLIHRLVRSAGEAMAASKAADVGAELLAPLEAMAEEPEMDAGGPSFTIFRSPQTMERYRTSGQPKEKLVVANHFHIAPLIESTFAPQAFFILGLSRKYLRLFHCHDGHCTDVALPASVPSSLEAAGQFDKPDHDLANRSSSGSSAGQMKGVHFGTLSDHEAAPEYLHDFFLLVDRGLKGTLGVTPLLLAGVHEEITGYRRLAKYPHVLSTEMEGNLEHVSLAEIGTRGMEAVMEHQYRIGERMLAEYRELTDRRRVLGETHGVVHAAAQGRIHQLCVQAGAEVIEEDPELDSAGVGREDLVNAAVVLTLRAGGEVFVLPEARMRPNGPLAAILRF